MKLPVHAEPRSRSERVSKGAQSFLQRVTLLLV